MKKLKSFLNPLLFFLMGSVFMSMILVITRCEKYGSALSEDINPDELVEHIDYESIKKAGADIESAFLAADQAVIDQLVLSESRDLYKDKQLPYTPDELKKIGNAFKTREMTTAGENFAEFTYIIEGEKYTMTLTCEKNGDWKIIRY